MTREEAKTIAREECARRGWPWMEPISVHWGFFSYRVWTNSNCRGANASIRIRKKDGKILSAGIVAY